MKVTAPIWIGSDGVRRPETRRFGSGAELEVQLTYEDEPMLIGWYNLTELQEGGAAIGAPASEHITAQAKESAAELRAQGWHTEAEAGGLVVHLGHTEALEARLGRLASRYERAEFERLIRAELKEPSR